jgi:hypothetical protein
MARRCDRALCFSIDEGYAPKSGGAAPFGSHYRMIRMAEQAGLPGPHFGGMSDRTTPQIVSPYSKDSCIFRHFYDAIGFIAFTGHNFDPDTWGCATPERTHFSVASIPQRAHAAHAHLDQR